MQLHAQNALTAVHLHIHTTWYEAIRGREGRKGKKVSAVSYCKADDTWPQKLTNTELSVNLAIHKHLQQISWTLQLNPSFNTPAKDDKIVQRAFNPTTQVEQLLNA